MLNEEVVLLDSDEEAPKAIETDTAVVPITEMNDIDGSLDKDNETGVDDAEEVVVEYNHNDYADLVGPLVSSNVDAENTNGSSSNSSVITPMASPAPSISSTPPPLAVAKAVTPAPSLAPAAPNNHPMKIPKRPGAMPPFALFSQEMRAKLQEEDPEIGFGDLGRKLGEMWHALQEEEKEDYRKRAREVADAKMKSWKETMSNMPAHKQLEMERQKRAPMKIKKKKTSGYAIFCSEYRRKYATEQPNMPFADISKQVAEDWRSCSEEARKGYEEKAQRFNTEEEKRWRQKIYAHQQNQMRMAAQNRQKPGGYGGRGGQTGWGAQRQQQGYRPIQPNYGGRGRGGYNTSQQYKQQQQMQSNSNSSGLVISSVSSLSTTQANNFGPGLGLPQGISIHKAEPDINLPSSITISRVEPEIQIVEENISRKAALLGVQQTRGRGGVISPGRGRGGVVINRGRAMSSMGMRSRGPGRPPMTSGRMMSPRGSMRGMPPVRGRPSLIPNGMGSRGAMTGMMSRGRGMMSSSRGMRGMSMQNMGMTSPLKRMSPMGGHSSPRAPGMPPMKRARMPGPYNTLAMGSAGQTSQNLNSAGAVNPATLDPVGRLCRVCGAPNAVIFRLKEKPELVGRIGRVLNLSIDLEADTASGYPGVICRKCCNLVETFFHYKKSVAEGQASLKKQVEEFKEKKAAVEEFKKKEAAEQAARQQAEAVERERERQLLASRSSPESIGVDPLDSILPDQGSSILPDASQPDTKVGNIKIKQESLKTQVATSTSNTNTAPMTAVFTDAMPDLRIKIEPGLAAVKKEKVDEREVIEVESTKKLNENASVTSEENNTPGELFNQLVGEVNKLNEKGEEKNKEQSTPEPVLDSSESVDKTIDKNTSASVDAEKAIETQLEEKSVENDDSFTLAISNVTTQYDEEETAVKSVTEVLDDISDTLEAVTKQIVSKQSEVKQKELTASESNDADPESSKDVSSLPEDNSVSESRTIQPSKTAEFTDEIKDSRNNDKAKDSDDTRDAEPVKEASSKKTDEDKLFSDIDVGEDPWSNAFDKSKDPETDPSGASGSWIPDDRGMDDLEAAPGMAIRNLRQRSDFFYDEDYYNSSGGDVEGGEGDLVPGADDPLMEMDDDATGDTDDFGGYDPLKLVQMTGGELNDLDFEMEDFDEDITMEDHDIMEDKDEHTEDGVDHEKDVDLTDEIQEVCTEESKSGDKESEVIDRENDDLNISDESGLSDSRDGLNKDFDQGGDELDEDNYNLDNDADPPEESPDTTSKMSDKLSKSKNGACAVEKTFDDSKEDETVHLDNVDISSEQVMGEINNDFTDNLAGEENLNEDCDDDLKDDDKRDISNYQQEDHNFESVECTKTNNFDGTSDDKDCINDDIDHQSDDQLPTSVRKSLEDQHNVLSEDVSTDNFENGPNTENVDDINDFSATEEADFEFQIDQVQSIQDSSQAEDSTGPEPGSNCDNSA